MEQFSVTKDGKPLDKSLYTWDEKTRTLSTTENNLVLDFSGLDNCAFKTGSICTFNTGHNCTFDTGWDCTFKTDYSCIFYTGSGCTFDTDWGCTFRTDSYCTFNTGHKCTFKTGLGCTFDTGDNCTFKTDWDCTFDTGYNCTFKTGSDCIFNTGYNCTFDTDAYCTFKTGSNCVIIRRDIFEVIKLAKDTTTQLAPCDISGYVKNGYYYKNGKKRYKAIIADGILSEIIKQRGNVYKVKNHGQNEITYLVKDGDIYSHGKTLKEAKESLIYKISNRDTTKYKDYTLDTKVSKKDAIQMYRCITGACEQGTRMFVESLENIPESLTVKEIIDITKGQYGNDEFRKFFRKGE